MLLLFKKEMLQMKKGLRFLSFVLVFTLFVGMLPFTAIVPSATDKEVDTSLISKENKEMRLWYNSPAPDDDNREWDHNQAKNTGWETESLNIGNSYFGAKVFGITERERIQISDKTLYTNGGTQTSGNTSFTETYLHFDHTYSSVENYERDLVLNDATSHVKYDYNGVTYTREYFASYPDKVMVIKLTANGTGNLNFTLEPKIPYYVFEGKTGDVTPSEITTDGSVSVGTLTIEGNLPGSNQSAAVPGYQEGTGTVGYDMDFEAQYRVFATGGTMTTGYNSEGGTVDSVDEYANGTITVSGADSAYIIIALDTNYELDPSVFLQADKSKKLEGFAHPHEKVSAVIDAASAKSYDELRAAHVADYTELFSRVAIDLGTDVPDIPTNELMDAYRNGDYSTYVEELLFAFGGYTLIASSRSGTLPPNLQGVWNRYHGAVCMNAYWGNVNIQMNFWSAFSTDLAECFDSYVEYYNAYISANTVNATNALIKAGSIASASEVQGDLWCMETAFTPFTAPSSNGGRDGWGNTPFMAESFWDYYDYTRDESILTDVTLPALMASANFLSMLLQYDEETGYYLTPNSGSPEQSTTSPYINYVNNNPGYVPKGTTYDQALTYSNYMHVLEALEYVDESTLSDSDRAVIARIREQIDKLDPIPIGLSGQVKEFREEQYYGEIGEKDHRHISHLLAIYPASVINANTPAWIDATNVSLDGRGDNFTWGWSIVCHILARARAKQGNLAYDRLNYEIITNVANNLCTLGGGNFQVEANLGSPAAISEMLLQSHNGYIEPLAALPDAWSAGGSYSGLVARGNFSVGAAWENGLAKIVTIESGSGGTASVYYPGISNVTVKTKTGEKVNFTVQNRDLICFDTVKGETYVITGFTAVEEMDSPETLGYSVSSNGTFSLACSNVPDAIGYKLYTATESAADYTFAGTSADGKFTYTPDNINKRITFAVTAVSAEGSESDRTLAYYVPVDSGCTVSAVVGSVLESGDAQFTVKATGTVSEYRLYSVPKVGEEYTLITSSKYPIINCGTYSTDCHYYVSVVNSYTSEESERMKVSKYGSSSSADYDSSNILAGHTFVAGDLATATHSGIHSGVTVYYDYTKLTDGGTHYQTGRYSTRSSDSSQVLDGTVDLGGTYVLSELDIYDFNATASTAPFMGTGIEIQAYYLGRWSTVASCSSNAEIIEHRVGTTYLSFDLGGVRAEKIRIYIPGRLGSNTISINEIKCSGVLDTTEYKYSDNLLSDKTFVPTSGASALVHSANFGYSTMTDGVKQTSSGRFSTKVASYSPYVDATVDFGAKYTVGEFRIYDYIGHSDPNKTTPTYAGTELLIEGYSDGEWRTLVSCSQADYSSHRVFKTATVGGAYLAFDLGDATVEKLRLYIPSAYGSTSISFYEVECMGYYLNDSASVGAETNILSGKTFVKGPDAAPVHTGTSDGVVIPFDYDKLTDGNYSYKNGRFSTKSGTTHIFDASVEFGGTYKLNELILYDYDAYKDAYWSSPGYAGKDLLVEVLVDGVWVSVIDCVQADFVFHRAGTQSSASSGYLTFDLGGIVAEGMRMYQSGGYGSNAISYYEIILNGEAYTYPATQSNRDNVLADVTDVSVSGTVDADHPVENLLDGVTTDYVSVGDSSYTVTLNLEDVSVLKLLRIYEDVSDNLIDGVTATASDNTTVEVLRDGKWLMVYRGISLSATGRTTIDMLGIDCTAIRLTFENTRLFDGESEYRSAKVTEISSTIASSPVDRSELLETYLAIEVLEKDDVFGYEEMKRAYLESLLSALMDVNADQTAVDAYTAEAEKILNTLNTETPEVDLVTDAYGDFTSYNLMLGGNIGFNFYADLDSAILDTYPDAFVVIEYVEYANKTANTVKELRKLADIPTDASGRYVITLNLPAAQMTDNVKLRIVFNGTNMGRCIEESIRSYADKIIANENGAYTAADIDLVKAMLNYGGKAQTYFGYNTDRLANDGIDVSQIENSASCGVFATTGETLSGVRPVSWTLALESNVKIRLYVRISNIDDHFITAENLSTDESFMIIPTHEYDDVYKIEIEVSDAKYIDDIYTLSIREISGAKTMYVNVSAMRYLDKVTDGTGYNADLVALCEAMKLYCSAANGYT